MSEAGMYQIAIGALISVISALATAVVKLYKKQEKTEEKLINFAVRIRNGDSEIIEKIYRLLCEYRDKKSGKKS